MTNRLIQIQDADIHPATSNEGKRGIVIEFHPKPAQKESLSIVLTIAQAADLATKLERLISQAARSQVGPSTQQ